MIRNHSIKALLSFCALFNFLLIHAQTGKELEVKPLKSTYEWNEKAIIEYAGLPKREAYSGRYDDVVIVPAGTPDNAYTDAQRVYASKPSGQAEFTLPGAGRYEARIYLYDKPGVVAARSLTFQVMSVEEGSLESKTEEALVQIAMRNRSRDKVLMCKAVNEYLGRKSAANHPNYTGIKALQSLCPKAADKTTSNSKPLDAYPMTARYQCYRLLTTGNEVAEDLFILPGNKYKLMNKIGSYSYNAKTKALTFTSGPLFIPSDKWIGIYTAKGEPIGNGGKAADAMIEIRRQSDVNAGNKKVLQQCNCVK